MNPADHEQLDLFGSVKVPEDEVPWLILSLKQRAYDLLVSGRKTFEFRRRFRTGRCNAFIYVTLPKKAICGYVQFGDPIRGTPEEIAAIAEKMEAGKYEAVHAYLNDQGYGFAIPVLGLVEIEPLGLDEARSRFQFQAPQSFIYLSTGHPLFGELMGRRFPPK